MQSIAYRALQALLWFAAGCHLVIGGGIMFSADFQHALAPLYSAEVHWTPQLTYILRPLGAFMFVFGVLLAVASLDPLRHQPVVYGLCAVLCLRALQRVMFYREAQEGFGIDPGWYLAMGGFFLAMAITIVVLLGRVSRPPATTASANPTL